MIEYASVSKTGEKPRNEDAVRVFINRPLRTYGFVLADGLGGHDNGDLASNFAADCVGAAIENTDRIDADFLAQCFQIAQDMLMDEKERRSLNSIKTTLVILLITDGVARWGHIGDSRLYHFREGRLVGRTMDHSLPQMLALSGQIREADIRRHPERSVLLRAMGADWNSPAYEIDQSGLTVQPGDSFLLCSDGFWDWIDERAMLRCMKTEHSAFSALQRMTAEVTAAGTGRGMDNYSAILANIR